MNLYPAHIVFGNVAGNITFADGVSVRKGHNARDRVDFRHYEALVLLHFPGFIIEIIAHIQHMELSLRAVLVADLHLHFCPWRILRGDMMLSRYRYLSVPRRFLTSKPLTSIF